MSDSVLKELILNEVHKCKARGFDSIKTLAHIANPEIARALEFQAKFEKVK